MLLLLGAKLPDSLTTTDIDLQRSMFCALAYARLGQMDKSEQELEYAQSLSDRHPSALAGELYRIRGAIDLERNNLAHANEMFRQSLLSARQNKDQFLEATALLNLGVVALRREHFDEALEWSRQASASAQAIGAHVLQEKSQGNIAWAEYQLGNFQEALLQSQKALDQAKALGSVIDEVEWGNNTGLSLYRLQNTQEAIRYYQNSLQLAKSIGDQEEIIETNTTLASVYLDLGQTRQAEDCIHTALLLSRATGRIFDEMDALFVKALISICYQRWDESEKLLQSLEQNPQIRPSLQWHVEGALANIYARTSKPQLADKWYRQSITTFETQRATLKREESRLPFGANADQLYDDYVRFLVHHNHTSEALTWLDLGRARTLEEGLGLPSPDFHSTLGRPLDTRAMAQRLHGTILVYNLAAPESYLWAINSQGTHFFKLPPQDEINAHLRKYQQAILNSRDTLADSYADGMALYNILVAPAQKYIPKGSPVYIVPDGNLATFNFETLLAPGGGIHYWIEDAVITEASSLKLLAAFHPESHPPTTKKLLMMGDPISPDEKFPTLLNAGTEVASIASHFPASTEAIFTQKRAVPSAYARSTPGQFSFIHFVSHGTSSSAQPLDSAIVLSREPSNPDSFKLYARDIIQQPLHAELVTISACYGSGSRIFGGEGLIGLSWAFLRAGAHYVIGSLWEASDAAAPQLMDRMYDELAQGRSPDQALRDAKLSLLHSQDVFRKPLYWATFQLYGGS